MVLSLGSLAYLKSRQLSPCQQPEVSASTYIQNSKFLPSPRTDPRQALCQQTLEDWNLKFSPLGVRLSELTSDSTSYSGSLRDLASADIIVTTPEKWDSVTRRWKDHAFLVGADWRWMLSPVLIEPTSTPISIQSNRGYLDTIQISWFYRHLMVAVDAHGSKSIGDNVDAKTGILA